MLASISSPADIVTPNSVTWGDGKYDKAASKARSRLDVPAVGFVLEGINKPSFVRNIQIINNGVRHGKNAGKTKTMLNSPFAAHPYQFPYSINCFERVVNIRPSNSKICGSSTLPIF